MRACGGERMSWWERGATEYAHLFVPFAVGVPPAPPMPAGRGSTEVESSPEAESSLDPVQEKASPPPSVHSGSPTPTQSDAEKDDDEIRL